MKNMLFKTGAAFIALFVFLFIMVVRDDRVLWSQGVTFFILSTVILGTLSGIGLIIYHHQTKEND